jgi:hypothetical protein
VTIGLWKAKICSESQVQPTILIKLEVAEICGFQWFVAAPSPSANFGVNHLKIL